MSYLVKLAGVFPGTVAWVVVVAFGEVLELILFPVRMIRGNSTRFSEYAIRVQTQKEGR